MDGPTLEIAVVGLVAVTAGVAGGWMMRDAACRRSIAKLAHGLQDKLAEMTRQRDRLAAKTDAQQARLEEQAALISNRDQAVAGLRTEVESAREREQRLKKDIFLLRGEREEFKTKLGRFQSALTGVRQQAADLQSEFERSREFYKSELRKSFEKRKELQAKLENAKQEHASFSNLLASSRTEHEAINKLLRSAQLRLADMDDLEHQVTRLEAENAQLNHDARLAQREIDSLKRDVAELEELKVQNKELAHCLESMESSRRQYEDDARRYREQVDETEKKSETLRIRLDEVEKNFAEIQNEQQKALRDAREASRSQRESAEIAPPQEVDNLQDIVGIGNVFERGLHDLGIYSFRQIANFGPADIARINRELPDCSGRLEQDDWIGQARELLYKKYGPARAS